jgi:hypothetical protein
VRPTTNPISIFLNPQRATSSAYVIAFITVQHTILKHRNSSGRSIVSSNSVVSTTAQAFETPQHNNSSIWIISLVMANGQPLLLFIYWNDAQFPRCPGPIQETSITTILATRAYRLPRLQAGRWRRCGVSDGSTTRSWAASEAPATGEHQDELMMRPWASEWGSGTALPCAVSGTRYSSTRWAGIDDDPQAGAEQAGNRCSMLPTWWYCFFPSCYCECKLLFLLSATYFWFWLKYVGSRSHGGGDEVAPAHGGPYYHKSPW